MNQSQEIKHLSRQLSDEKYHQEIIAIKIQHIVDSALLEQKYQILELIRNKETNDVV